jgi:hypothetical protein
LDPSTHFFLSKKIPTQQESSRICFLLSSSSSSASAHALAAAETLGLTICQDHEDDHLVLLAFDSVALM